jgi:prophage DNA circulation protein
MNGAFGSIVGGINETAATVNAVSRVASTVGNLAGSLASLASGNPFSLGYGGAIQGLGPWADRLQPASWRGVQFAIREAPIKRGRRVALHEYVNRDDPWPEDLGRASRLNRFTGFLVGDDVYDQRDAMIAAAEVAGPGILVHPSLGAQQAVLLDFSATERSDLGRVVELEFTFVITPQTQPLFPSADQSTQDSVDDSADNADDACSDDFGSDIASSIQYGATVVSAGVATAQTWIGTAAHLVGDAGRVVGAVRGLAAVVGRGTYFGRYNVGQLTSAPTLTSPIPAALSTVAAAAYATNNLLAQSVSAVTAVTTAGSNFAGLVSGL